MRRIRFGDQVAFTGIGGKILEAREGKEAKKRARRRLSAQASFKAKAYKSRVRSEVYRGVIETQAGREVE